MPQKPWASQELGEHATEATGLTSVTRRWGGFPSKVLTVAREPWCCEHPGRILALTRLRPEEIPWGTGIGLQDREGGVEGPHADRIDLEQEHKQGEESERDSRDKDTQYPHGQNHGLGTV